MRPTRCLFLLFALVAIALGWPLCGAVLELRISVVHIVEARQQNLRGRFFEAVKGKILVESLVRGGREEVIWVTTVWAALVGIFIIGTFLPADDDDDGDKDEEGN